MMLTTRSIRNEFHMKLLGEDIADDGNLEIVNASFIADEPAIFGQPNHDWHARERAWYNKMSLNVNDIEPPIPQIWKGIAAEDGTINSNYGWCIFSKDNGNQYTSAIDVLINAPTSRQAVMIYNRPSMHVDSKAKGMRDFMCTYATQLIIRKGLLHYLVFMRSSDAVYGYKGDWAWHNFIHDLAVSNLHMHNVKKGHMHWNAGSIHVYPRHFHLVK